LHSFIDSRPSFRPDCFRTELFGCEVRFTYPVIKLLDFDRPDLEKDDSPFAVITRVQLAKIKSEKEPNNRYSFRLDLTKELYSRNYSKEQIILYRICAYHEIIKSRCMGRQRERGKRSKKKS